MAPAKGNTESFASGATDVIISCPLLVAASAGLGSAAPFRLYALLNRVGAMRFHMNGAMSPNPF